MLTGLVRAALLAGVLACTASAGPDSPSRVAGSWIYEGTQTSPQPASLAGSVSWTGVPGGLEAFEGTFNVVEQPQTGSSRVLAGVTAGQLADSIADFDLIVGGEPRRHLGKLRGNSISGSWASQTSSSPASGTFAMRRE